MTERKFKVGDLVICSDPRRCKLPADQVARVIAVDWIGDDPFVEVYYNDDRLPSNRTKRREWVFNHWSPTAATDAGAIEYEEIILAQDLLNEDS